MDKKLEATIAASAIAAANANQFQGMLKLAREGKSLAKTVHELPAELDQEIASTKLSTMDIQIDKLTAEQASYADDYSAGT